MDSPELLTVAEVAARKRVTPAAVRGWITAGVATPVGPRVRLDAERAGGDWRITVAALAEFIRSTTLAHLSPDDSQPPAHTRTRSTLTPNKRADAARKALRKRHGLPV